jgi:hypothetical protein
MFADRYMRVYGEVFERLSHVLVEQWDRAVATSQSVDVHHALMLLSLDALGADPPRSLPYAPWQYTQRDGSLLARVRVCVCVRVYMLMPLCVGVHVTGHTPRLCLCLNAYASMGGLNVDATVGVRVSAAAGMCGFGTDFQALTDPHNTYMDGSQYMLQSALLQTAFVPTLFRTFFGTIARRSDQGTRASLFPSPCGHDVWVFSLSLSLSLACARARSCRRGGAGEGGSQGALWPGDRPRAGGDA